MKPNCVWCLTKIELMDEIYFEDYGNMCELCVRDINRVRNPYSKEKQISSEECSRLILKRKIENEIQMRKVL